MSCGVDELFPNSSEKEENFLLLASNVLTHPINVPALGESAKIFVDEMGNPLPELSEKTQGLISNVLITAGIFVTLPIIICFILLIWLFVYYGIMTWVWGIIWTIVIIVVFVIFLSVAYFAIESQVTNYKKSVRETLSETVNNWSNNFVGSLTKSIRHYLSRIVPFSP